MACVQLRAAPRRRYPAHLVGAHRLADGTGVVIRPIREEDEALVHAFFDGLSAVTRYQRLLSGRKPPPHEIAQLVRVDYDCELALIAVGFDRLRGRPIELGEARYVRDVDGASAEFALVVGDAWQGKGLGTLLLERLCARARASGILRLYGITLATNHAVQGLARKLGFAVSANPGDATLRRVEKLLIAAPVAQFGDPRERPPVPAANDAGANS